MSGQHSETIVGEWGLDNSQFTWNEGGWSSKNIRYDISKEDLVAPCRWWAGLASPSPPAVMVRSSSSSSVEILFFLFAKECSCTPTFLERIFERQTWIQFKTQNKVLHQRLNQMKICFSFNSRLKAWTECLFHVKIYLNSK